MSEDANQIRQVPERCLQCIAFNRVLLIRETADGGADLATALQPLGLQVHVLASGSSLAQLDEFDYEFVLWDTHLPAAEETAAIRHLLRQCPRLPIIVLTNDAHAETAIELVKAGAHDLLARPFQISSLRLVVQRALHTRRLLCAALLIPGVPAAQVSPVKLVGRSQPMQEVFKRIGLLALRDESVLILGETGTGKELVARTIHRHGERSDRPFLAINCAAIPENLLESELIGHEKGAFTGASQRRLGAFECAQGGTLFLDEIGDMSLPLQAKILRVLQQREIHRLGGNETIAVDVRVLTATNKTLANAIHNGAFREDLYYRLNVVSIRLPALREHREDIPELVEYFLDRYTLPGSPRPAVDAAALWKLQNHHWPGNIRELENTIRRALVTANGQAMMERDVVLGEPASCSRIGAMAQCAHCQLAQPNNQSDASHGVDTDREPELEIQLNSALQQWFAHQARSPSPAGPDTSARLEAMLLDAALKFTHGNQVKAARLLGISRSTLRQRLSKRLPQV